MSFERPTLTVLIARVQADFVSRLGLTGAVLRRSIVFVLSRVIAGAAHMLHGHLDWLAKQLFPSTSDDAQLITQAALFGLAKTSATYAVGVVTITGTDTTIIPAGTILVRSDGEEYETAAEVTITGGEIDATVTALEAGELGSLTVGVVLTFQSPIAGADSEAEVDSVTSDGTDEEATDDLRVRLLARMAEAPHGGTEADHVAWAKEVSGTTRAWADPGGLGPGTVVVRFARDGDASPIPDAGEVAVMQAYLDTKVPAYATVTAHAPTAAALALTVEITPDTAALQAVVEAELADLLLREGEPGGTILLSAIRTAIGNAPGITDYVLTVPAADVTHTTNQLPTLGTVTFV